MSFQHLIMDFSFLFLFFNMVTFSFSLQLGSWLLQYSVEPLKKKIPKSQIQASILCNSKKSCHPPCFPPHVFLEIPKESAHVPHIQFVLIFYLNQLPDSRLLSTYSHFLTCFHCSVVILPFIFSHKHRKRTFLQFPTLLAEDGL